MRPTTVERITIGDRVPLEAVAEESNAGSDHYAVVCHPHPLHGGTMDNKVVTTVARALLDLDIPAVRFNFRGVGASAGTFDAGIGETDDAAAAADWGAARWPGRRLIIAGFSFGAYVALRLAQQRDAAQLITIAPPVALFDCSGMRAPACPWLVVQGDADEVVDPRQVIRWVESLEPRPTLVVMPGVGHFFHGRLPELKDAVRHAIRDAARDAL